MPRLEVLVEEPSAEAALRYLLPKLVPVAVRWKIGPLNRDSGGTRRRGARAVA